MNSVRIAEDVAENFVKRLQTKGEEALYRYSIAQGIIRSAQQDNSEVEVLNLAEAFFLLYRRTGEDNYFVIGRILRRAAHTLYRHFMRNKIGKAPNKRFLSVVR